MEWVDRLKALQERAKATTSFKYSHDTNKKYKELQGYISAQDKHNVKRLIIEMGF